MLQLFWKGFIEMVLLGCI